MKEILREKEKRRGER
jgi:hypothetical protein